MEKSTKTMLDQGEVLDEEPHLTEMDRQAETRVSDDGYWD